VGLPGLERGTSSLSGIEGPALCGAAFFQLAGDRQGRSNALFEASTCAVVRRPDHVGPEQADGLLGELVLLCVTERATTALPTRSPPCLLVTVCYVHRGGMALSGPLEVKSPRQACATAHTPPAAAAREWRRSMRAHLRPPHPVRPPGVRVAAPLVNPQVRYRSAPFGRYRFRNIPKGIARNHITIPSWGRTKATGTESANSSTGDSDERSSHR
jgi:hypothetical protein